MHHKTSYASPAVAINALKEQGYTIDFNLEENCVVCHEGKFEADELEIVAVYRYEGNTDPSDEAAVYAIESKSGLKGILVDGYGVTSDAETTRILQKIPIRK